MDPELHRAVRTLAMAGRGLERAAAPLTLPQYRVLALIVSAPERASRLAARVDVTKAALTGVLDALESHGWIVREVVAGDRRGVSLAVTDAGAAVLARADEAMVAWLAEVMEDDPNRHQVVCAISRLGDALTAARHRATA
ncbi:MAG: MarR family transcriptional regulator [Acidimicrobiales bacterium]